MTLYATLVRHHLLSLRSLLHLVFSLNLEWLLGCLSLLLLGLLGWLMGQVRCSIMSAKKSTVLAYRNIIELVIFVPEERLSILGMNILELEETPMVPLVDTESPMPVLSPFDLVLLHGVCLFFGLVRVIGGLLRLVHTLPGLLLRSCSLILRFQELLAMVLHVLPFP